MISVPDPEQARLMPAGLALPLVMRSSLSGDAGFGVSAPSILPVADGILVSRKRVLSFHTADLTREVWRREVDGWSRALVRVGDNVVHGPVAGSLTVYATATGHVVKTIPCTGMNVLEATGDAGRWFLLWRQEGLVAIDCQARPLWERATLPTHCVVADAVVLITEHFDRRLVALDRANGTERWRFEVPLEGKGEAGGRSSLIPAGFPSVAVVGDRVIVLTMDFRMFVLSLATGTVIAQARPPFPGWYVITDRSIFFKQAFGLSEYDHHELREVDRIEYRSEVEPLYKGKQFTVNAFCLTEESVIWTTMHGALMGVSRKPGPGGQRVSWCHEIAGAVMPLAEAPAVFGEHLYFTNKGQDAGLLCFRSASV